MEAVRMRLQRDRRALGLLFHTLIGSTRKRRERTPAKYRNPDNPRQTWTGKGRQPVWLKEVLDGGGSLAELEIQ